MKQFVLLDVYFLVGLKMGLLKCSLSSIWILILQTKSFVESLITVPKLLQERCEVSFFIPFGISLR
jgi:hypothetical protein